MATSLRSHRPRAESDLLNSKYQRSSKSTASPIPMPKSTAPVPKRRKADAQLFQSPTTSSSGSSESSSEVGPEIVVWTDNMEVDSVGGSGSENSSPESTTHEAAPVDYQDVALLAPINTDTGGDSSLSALTDLSEISSIQSHTSSKATTPVEEGVSRDSVKESPPRNTIPQSQQTTKPHLGKHRFTFNVQPKSSIPNDIPQRQYAGECILAAESSRLNPYALHPEEYELLRYHISHTQVSTYLNLRNGILRLWLKRPWTLIGRNEAIGCANARWYDTASVCYDWLVRGGYINYGCVQMPPTTTSHDVPRSKRQKTIAVIGAGISGLGCARQLDGLFRQYADRFHEDGADVPRIVILEGRNRVGGRVYSREFRTKPKVPNPLFEGKRHTAEMGGMIITGFDRGNPMNILVRGQLSLPYHALTAETTIYDSNGGAVDPIRDELVEKLYNDCLDRVSEFKHKLQPSKLIEGNREFIDEGRDSLGDGAKSIIQAEEAAASLPHAAPVSQQSVPEKVNMVPISADKLTGRIHNQPGVPANLKVPEKVKLMGWTLRNGVTEESTIDLRNASTQEDATLGSVLDHTITEYKHLVDLTPQDYRLINWHIANLEYSNATNLHNLSLGLWDIDTGNEWEGQHTMVVGGYQGVARGLLRCPSPLELKNNFSVESIKYDAGATGSPALITCEDGSIVEADHLVCTVPLGVLKHDNITFNPALPSEKLGVIERLGWGILNKVVLVYESVFWDSTRHIFGVLRDAPRRQSTVQSEYSADRGRFFQWFNVSNTTGLPCLIALMAGDAGYETEFSSNDALVAEATEILRGVFGDNVPNPVEAIVTRWGSDRFARGSYSSAAPTMRSDDYDVMSKSIGNLHFAGEHTIGTHPATVHGAYLSGLRAASEILTSLIGPIEIPTPLILPRDSLLLSKRKAAALDPAQAEAEAFDNEVYEHIQSKLGERPSRPAKLPGNPYLLFSRANFEVVKQRSEEARKQGKSRAAGNEPRAMMSRLWKETTAEQRSPYEEEAAQQKKQYAEDLLSYDGLSETWDREASGLREVYEKAHPRQPSSRNSVDSVNKSRRGRNINNVEDDLGSNPNV